MKRKLNIAVRELVEFVCRSGDLTVSFSGARRSVEAIRAHQKIQNSRPQTYRPEVSIALQHESDAFLLRISGRIDGVFSETDAGTDSEQGGSAGIRRLPADDTRGRQEDSPENNAETEGQVDGIHAGGDFP